MSRLRRRGVCVAVVVALCLLCLAAATATGAAAERSAAAQNETTDPDVDTTVTRISVAENGTAHWTIEIRTRLDDEESVEQYEAYQERFRENRTRYLDRFSDRMIGVVENAESATGREMRAEGFAAETSIQEVPRRWGVVTYSFRWHNFGTTDGDAVSVGDAFEGGYYLAEGDSLVIEAPPGYEVAAASPPADATDDGDPTWTGRRNFDDREPAVRFAPTTDTGDPETDGESAAGAFPVAHAALALLGLCVAGGLAYAGWRGDRSIGLPIGTDADGDDDPGGDDDADGDNDPDDGARGGSQDPGRDSGSTAPTAADRSSPDAGGEDAAQAPDAELLTDEDRVRQLLTENGGRLKQQQIADEFDWSASKTSRVLSSMVDEGTVEKLRIGRENVIDLADD